MRALSAAFVASVVLGMVTQRMASVECQTTTAGLSSTSSGPADTTTEAPGSGGSWTFAPTTTTAAAASSSDSGAVSTGESGGSAAFTKRSNQWHCYWLKFSHTRYEVLATAENACAAASGCYGVYDYGCDGSGFYLCAAPSTWTRSWGVSCMYEKGAPTPPSTTSKQKPR